MRQIFLFAIENVSLENLNLYSLQFLIIAFIMNLLKNF